MRRHVRAERHASLRHMRQRLHRAQERERDRVVRGGSLQLSGFVLRSRVCRLQRQPERRLRDRHHATDPLRLLQHSLQRRHASVRRLGWWLRLRIRLSVGDAHTL